jgi:hypothetical protein
LVLINHLVKLFAHQAEVNPFGMWLDLHSLGEPVRATGAAVQFLSPARADAVIGSFKTGVIRRRGAWRAVEDVEDVESAPLEWVDWFSALACSNLCCGVRESGPSPDGRCGTHLNRSLEDPGVLV